MRPEMGTASLESPRARHFLKILRILIAEKFSGERKSKKVTGLANLGRQVAIKVLPDTCAHDPDRLARFEREAKTLASLKPSQHRPDLRPEKADGIRALVMELVEGPTLADRIAQGAIPVDEALPIRATATQDRSGVD
ncbi:MAG: hypothetical protein ACRD8O_22660 [Bryobacteraceae bacterium]